MKTLTMALATALLAAALLVGSGRQNVSRETRQDLDLSGEWEGTYQDSKNTRFAQVHGVRDEGRGEAAVLFVTFLPHTNPRFPPGTLWFYRNEGNGRALIEYIDGTRLVAHFCQSAGRVILCIRKDSQDPTCFRADKNQSLLTLHRVKPDK